VPFPFFWIVTVANPNFGPTNKWSGIRASIVGRCLLRSPWLMLPKDGRALRRARNGLRKRQQASPLTQLRVSAHALTLRILRDGAASLLRMRSCFDGLCCAGRPGSRIALADARLSGMTGESGGGNSVPAAPPHPASPKLVALAKVPQPSPARGEGNSGACGYCTASTGCPDQELWQRLGYGLLDDLHHRLDP
jgi:hypothetical protein